MTRGMAIIYLDQTLLSGSSGLPKDRDSKWNHLSEQLYFSEEKRPLYLTLLRVWFAVFRKYGIPYRDLQHYCWSGELLPRLFTLTPTEVEAVFFLWHYQLSLGGYSIPYGIPGCYPAPCSMKFGLSSPN